eukprot:UN28727
MSMLPAMLKKANYRTHAIGKWHMGFFSPEYTPFGRGFDTSFGYLYGGQTHFNQCNACPNNIPDPDWSTGPRECPAVPYDRVCNVNCPQEGGVDLYITDRPGYGFNGTYNAYMYNEQAIDVIKNNPKNTPFFMYLAIQDVHLPAQTTEQFIKQYPANDYNATEIPRRIYNGMLSSADSIIGNVTQALKEAGVT